MPAAALSVALDSKTVECGVWSRNDHVEITNAQGRFICSLYRTLK